MIRKLLILIMLPSIAKAHDGLHFHPHGVHFGWLALVAIGVFGTVIVWLWGRR